jgi:superoxide dismutase, Fe-Mn family
MEKYILPELSYGYEALEPYISKEVLTLHHTKHHQAYVNGANALLDKMEETRKNNADLDYKSTAKSLSFNIAGHILHSIFWQTMAPENSGKNQPQGDVLKAIETEFGSFDRFKKEFSETAKSVEGSGWAVLIYDKNEKRLLIGQIEKHNLNLFPEHKILLCLDVWEHAYYLDYKSDRAKFVENWWNIVNWQEVETRFTKN